MIWNEYSKLRGTHATFSPSQTSYVALVEKGEVDIRIANKYRAAVGTEIHNWAFRRIKRMHKVSSIKEIVSDIDEMIFDEYYDDSTDSISKYGQRLLKCLKGLPADVFETVKLYVNDAIGFKMEPEVVLYHSDDIYGCADAISFSSNVLRIHDLKTGSSNQDHTEQLLNYAALFCLQKKIDPEKIQIQLRIYKNGEVIFIDPIADDVHLVMSAITKADKIAAEF